MPVSPTIAHIVPARHARLALRPQDSEPSTSRDLRPDCYLEDERLFCRDVHCAWRSECCRLVATWRR